VSFVGTLQAPSTAGPSSAHDATLEALTERLSLARDRAELDDALHLMAHELDADEVRIGEPFAGEGGVGRVTQLLATDAAPADALAALAATGYGSRLSVPVRSGGVPLATLDAYATPARPWSRFEIRRARILSHALGAALSRIDGAASLSR
jgi:GAF domain-containing protein